MKRFISRTLQLALYRLAAKVKGVEWPLSSNTTLFPITTSSVRIQQQTYRPYVFTTVLPGFSCWRIFLPAFSYSPHATVQASPGAATGSVLPARERGCTGVVKDAVSGRGGIAGSVAPPQRSPLGELGERCIIS